MRVVGRELFPRKVITRFGDINWPLRSSDLSPMDSFVWGYLKRKEDISQDIQAIPQALYSKVFADASVQLSKCKRKHDEHLDDVIHHKQIPYGVV